jgi:hypothetical protein
MSSPERPAPIAAADHAARLERAAAVLRGAGEAPPAQALQEALGAAVALYADAVKRDGALPALPESPRPSATDVLIATAALLEAVDLEVFELGFWKAWGTTGGEAS